MAADTATTTTQPPSPPVLLRFKDLENKVRNQRPSDDLSLLRESFDFAAAQHGNQRRKSGEPYLVHPVEVAHLLADMRLDPVCVSTGLLHDVVEDTNAGIGEIKRRFGPEVARCVQGVTKLSRLKFYSAEARQAEGFRKMMLAMVEDIRVILVKLADRLHNMRTLQHLDPEKQHRIALQTLEIYAPIALRLGMGRIRGELEDLAFCYLEPHAYQEITEAIESKRLASEDFLDHIKQTLSNKLEEAQLPASVAGRIKRPFSIYQKLQRQQITIEQVYDLLALRVITDSEKNCYGALGVTHSLWRPVPGRFKDFIASPRPNLYQSLHTSVIDEQGQSFEVQIRSEEMHRMAEQGICAHWKYKEGRVGADDVEDTRMAWLRQLVEWQREMKDPGDFLSTLKIDLYPEEVYVFTPGGKLITLPRDATPVDFAYSIHTEVGHTCVGAKANGRIVPLTCKLSNGDIIEITTQPNHTPSRDWLTTVKTSRARNKIKHWLNTKQREKAEQIGLKLLEKEVRRLHASLKRITGKALEEVCKEYGCAQPPDLYAALGYGKYSARHIASKLLPQPEKPAGAKDVPEAPRARAATKAAQPASADQAVLKVQGIDDILVYRARCCNPIRGEAIVGYVTRGKGVAVHSANCANVQNLMYEAERRMEVEWADAQDISYRTKLVISVGDRPGVLADLTTIVSGEGVNISSLESSVKKEKSGLAVVEMYVDLNDVKQLDRLITAMKGIAGVRDVKRSRRG